MEIKKVFVLPSMWKQIHNRNNCKEGNDTKKQRGTTKVFSEKEGTTVNHTGYCESENNMGQVKLVN